MIGFDLTQEQKVLQERARQFSKRVILYAKKRIQFGIPIA